MRTRVFVEFIVDEDDEIAAEAELESLLSDTINSNLMTTVSTFHITNTEQLDTEEIEELE